MKKRIRIAAMLASALMLCGSAVPTALAADTSSAETSFSDLYEFGAVDEIAFRDMQKLDDKGIFLNYLCCGKFRVHAYLLRMILNKMRNAVDTAVYCSRTEVGLCGVYLVLCYIHRNVDKLGNTLVLCC